MTKGFPAILKQTRKILVFVPIVEPLAMEKIILKTPKIVLILWKDLKPESVSAAILIRSKIYVTLYIDAQTLSDGFL